MGACVKVGNRRSACLCIDEEILETAKRIGLNVSRVSENSLVKAIIDRLIRPKEEMKPSSSILVEFISSLGPS